MHRTEQRPVRLLVSLSRELHAELKDFARANATTMSQIVRHAIEQYLAREGAKQERRP